MKNISRILGLFGLAGLAFSAIAQPARIPKVDQNTRVIEVTAKKYDYSPSPIRVKLGETVQLKLTSLDRTHGFKLSAYPDGSEAKSQPGLVLSSSEDCFKIETTNPTVVQFVAKIPGTYSFHCCNRCGLGHGGMKGQIIVEP
jgi:cytochrome c oxidase subunit II